MTSEIKIGRVTSDPALSFEHAGAGDPVVFLHGIGGNRRNWRTNLPAFAARWRAVAWDARGYGDSDDYDGPLDFAAFAHDLARLLDALDAPQAHLVGISMGGRIALDFAALYPQRLLTLTLCSTHRGFAGFSEEKKRDFVRLRKEPLLNGATPQEIAGSVATSLLPSTYRPEAYAEIIDSIGRLHVGSYLKTIEASILGSSHGCPADIRVPTHVIGGGEDRLATPEMERELAAQIPGATLTILAGCGHLTNIEQPDRFNRAATEFLQVASIRRRPRDAG